jgi:hypothetical protein
MASNEPTPVASVLGSRPLAERLASVGAKVVRGEEMPERASLLSSLENMQRRSNDNWGALTAAIQEFVQRQRSELDKLEHWLGTK